MENKTNCANCKSASVQYVPLPMVELHSSVQERTIKRLWITIIILIGLLFFTNLGWIVYEAQFEDVTTTEITQENENGYNNYIGNDGDIINGETNNQENNDPQA